MSSFAILNNRGVSKTRALSTLLPRSFCGFLLLAFFFSTSAASAFAQESAARRTEYLRGHLTEVENAYAETIDRAAGETANVRRDRLRIDLRTKLENLFQRATSSEATLAVYRADADATLEAVRAYESVLGAGEGEGTTIWNVLSKEDLARMRGLATNRLNALRVERLNYPEMHVPASLEFRIREIEGWLGGLDAEAARRVGNDQIRLKPIRGELSADEARARYPEIAAADGQAGREQVFKRQLALQVNLRQHNAPGDASLAALGESLPTVEPQPLPPTVPRGPPTSVEAARDQLRVAHFDELNAVMRRDALAIAESRARAVTAREWLGHVSGVRPADRLGLDETPTEHLKKLRDGWQKQHARLVVEQQTLPETASVELQIKEAERRIREIDGIIERRLLPRPPPDTGGLGASPAPEGPQPPKSPAGRAFEKSWDRQLAHNELTELGKVANEPRVGRVDVEEAAAKAFRTRVGAEAQSIRAAYDETIQLQRKVLVSGRGPHALESGRQLRQARDLIQTAAEELRVSLADPAFRNDSTAVSAKALLSDIPRPAAPVAADAYGPGLTALEGARDAAEAAVRPTGMQIHSVAGNEASPDPAHRITLPGKPEPAPNPVIKKPSGYTELYPKGSGSQSIHDWLKDPKHAPGGIVVDATLPGELAARLKGLEVDTNSGEVKVSLNGSWQRLRQRPDPLLARTAWAFVLDGRTAVIDLRPLQDSEVLWLILQYTDARPSPSEQRELLQLLGSLTSVNVNDALRDTPLVSQLVVADQLMFDLLPRSVLAVQGEGSRYGLPLTELRAAYNADAAEGLNKRNWQDVLFNKSILAVSKVDYEDGPELTLTSRFSFNLFGVPAKGEDVVRLAASEKWFADHEGELRKLPQLSRLSEFASLVALFRAARDRNVPHNLDDLVSVEVPATDAPRFMVRRDWVNPKSWDRLKAFLSNKERQ